MHLVCTICADRFPYHWPCHTSHPGVCHSCAALNMHNVLDNPEHEAPGAPGDRQ